MLRKKKFSLNKRSEHIVSCDFRKIPDYIYNNAGIKREEIIQFPLVRMEGQNKLLINENDPDWEALSMYLSALDTLPDQILMDLYGLYDKECKGVTLQTVRGCSDTETARNIIYIVLPEILWCHGNVTIKGKFSRNK